MKFLNRPGAEEFTGLKGRQFTAAVKRGDLSEGVPINVWVAEELEADMAKLVAKRDAGIVPPGRAEVMESRRRGGLTAAARRAAARTPIESPDTTSSLSSRANT
jgi:hypothetical protein